MQQSVAEKEAAFFPDKTGRLPAKWQLTSTESHGSVASSTYYSDIK